MSALGPMLSPQPATLPNELIHLILEFSIESYDGSRGPQRAWISCVALILKSVHSIAMAKLYDIIQLKEEWSILLLATTLTNRHDLAHSVKALHLDQSLARRDDAQISGQRLIALCKNAFLQAHESAFDPEGHVFLEDLDALQSLPPWPGRRHLSISCTKLRYPVPHLELFHATHLHLGVGKSSESTEVFMSFIALFRHCSREIRVATTHFAVDVDPEKTYFISVVPMVADFLSRASPTLQRIVIRFPFTPQSDAHIKLQDQLSVRPTIRDPRIFVSSVKVEVSRDRDVMYELAVEGWRRHAQGIEDLWMSGIPVFPTI